MHTDFMCNLPSTIVQRLTLPLLVARVGTHDVYNAAATNDFAFVANAFNAGSNFHPSLPNTASIEYSRNI